MYIFKMKMLYIKISLCFTYLLQKCMPTNHLNAYNNAPMGFPQRGRAQQACSVVLTTSFVDRQNGLCAIFFTARSPDLHSCTAFFLNKENNKGHSFKLSCVSVLCKMV